ncbi:hypothetical protein BBK36DRAFT_1134697 [Trichoderma citrinoviride]|uniref:DUF8035 domain-containing protein n=1 Tax=Trichoderma citrinoviride TaxID=58853 RepID=A0A2T4BIM5_9HYPO|nr:hypothetical protein BBK36DRAFT_1134697 [Trichoderma citrinoviride]PTB69176.1 hypothetical protein BBK36DRAFT_1134697 [Trichoderma citrinoviride]
MASRGDRWERDRLGGDRDRVQERGRFVEEDRERDRVFMSGGRSHRDHSDERFDRKYGRTSYEDDIVRDRRFYEDDRFDRLDRRSEIRGDSFDRRVVMEKERDREYMRDSSPRRPTLLRRQSSLDTYDRRPLPRFLDQREEFPVPVRREDIRRDDILRDDYHAPKYTPIPLPKTRGLPPPARRYDERFYEDIHVEHDHMDEPLPRYPAERIVEREIIREKEKEKDKVVKEKRSRSRDSRSTKRSHHRRGRSRVSKSSSRSSSISSSSSSSSSSSGGTTVKSAKSSKSEYPKKGKTRIPLRLVSKRALIDIGYPFVEEKKKLTIRMISELEISAARSSAGDLFRERREEDIIRDRRGEEDIIRERREEVIIHHEAPAPPPPPQPQTIVVSAPAPPPPVIIEAAPRDAVELVDKTVYRDRSRSSSDRSRSRSRHRSHSRHHTHRHYRRSHYRHSHSRHSHSRHSSHGSGVALGGSSSDYQLVERHRSRSRSGKEIRAEIRALEKELAVRPRVTGEREVIRTERLPNGELVVYEEQVERVASHKPARIEKDKKGRMSISVPKYR